MSWSQSAVASGRASRDDTALMALIIYFHRTPAKQSKAKQSKATQSNARQRKARVPPQEKVGRMDGEGGWVGGLMASVGKKNDGGIR